METRSCDHTMNTLHLYMSRDNCLWKAPPSCFLWKKRREIKA